MLERIYDEAFFSEWGRSNPDYVATARLIAEAVHAQFAPRTLADLGCGCGVYSHHFSSLGVAVTAVDGVIPPPEHSFPVEILVRDLERPCPHSGEPYDLTLCLEVAEHIPEENLDIFLANVCSYGGLLLLSAAPPRQGGRHHVNEQPKRYWAARLERHGFYYNRAETGVLVERCKAQRPRYSWMWSQIGVYRRLAAPPPAYARPFHSVPG